MQDILQLSNRCNVARNGMNFKPSYRIRKLKNKGALLILVWNCLVMSTFQYLTTYTIMFHPTAYIYSNIWGLTLPIAGWLADVSLRMAHLQHISFAGINVIPQYIHCLYLGRFYLRLKSICMSSVLLQYCQPTYLYIV